MCATADQAQFRWSLQRTHHPPPVVARGNLAPPPASANQGKLCNLASQPLSAPSRPENPITLPLTPTALLLTRPVACPAASAVARRLICSSHLHPSFTCRLVFPSALLYGLPRINSLALPPVLVGSVLFCPVIHSSGFYPGESRASWKSWLSLSLTPLSLTLSHSSPPV